jgi:hypothetical protein
MALPVSNPRPAAHSHAHAHTDGHAHKHDAAPFRAVPVGASLLRMSVTARLAIAAAGVALIWAGVFAVTG